MGRLLATLLQFGHAAGLARAWQRFSRSASNPLAAQHRKLRALIANNRHTAYGQAHQFDVIDSPAQFQRRVPVVDYDTLEPWIDRIANGEGRVLTVDPVIMMEPSGGATATTKLIPYTRGLLAEFSAMTGPWLFDLYRRRPGLWGQRSYWAISPVTRAARRTRGGVPIGFDVDTEYFGAIERWALERLMVTPRSLSRVRRVDEWRKATAEHLFDAEDLGFISVWSPCFLTLLMEHIADSLQDLVRRARPERRRRIESRLNEAGHLVGEALWPGLDLVSSWTDGPAATQIPQLKRWFPKTSIQSKGLLATEGAITLPIVGSAAPVLAVNSHVFEFIDLEHPGRPPVFCNQLRPGASYSPLLTTSGGLYRYHLKDVVRCVGTYGALPCLTFEGKLDRVSDVCGEKLNERQIVTALQMARAEAGLEFSFALVAPVRSPIPHYCLYLETTATDEQILRALRVIESYLETGHHYRYCRDLGQLGPLRAARVANAGAAYQEALTAEGRRPGDLKPAHLDPRDRWDRVLAASPVEDSSIDPQLKRNIAW